MASHIIIAMKRSVLAAIALAAVCSASAQTDGAWSLDSCISYATTHNITVRQSRLQQVNDEIGVTSAKDAFLPTLHGSASRSWAFGRGLTADNTYANRNTSSTGLNVGMSLPDFPGAESAPQPRLRQGRTRHRP